MGHILKSWTQRSLCVPFNSKYSLIWQLYTFSPLLSDKRQAFSSAPHFFSVLPFLKSVFGLRRSALLTLPPAKAIVSLWANKIYVCRKMCDTLQIRALGKHSLSLESIFNHFQQQQKVKSVPYFAPCCKYCYFYHFSSWDKASCAFLHENNAGAEFHLNLPKDLICLTNHSGHTFCKRFR